MKQVTIRRCPTCSSIGSHTDSVVNELAQEPGVNVQVVDGQKGEFTVEVDGKRLPKSGDSMPTPEEVKNAVRGEAGASA